MSSEITRILLVEDSETDAKLILEELRGGGPVDLLRVTTAAAMREALGRGGWDAVISDWNVPGFGALPALEILKASGLDLPFLMVSGTIGEEKAVEAMRAGASDYVLKDRLARLLPALQREIRESRERIHHRRTEEELKASEEKLRQSQKMESIGRLAGGVAHDFNNLLTVIISYAGLVLEDLKEADPMRADLEEIRNAGHRAAALTHQLLAFSRQQVLAPKVVDLNEVVRGMEKMLRRLIGEDLELVTALAEDLGRVRVDPGQVEQVVLNLVVNARDAMPEGGTLTVATANDPGGVTLSVSDTGTGMDAATQARIFEPFFTTKEKGKGTGLGLSTVLGIVEQSGGLISVESDAGKGASFRIQFPRTVDEQEPQLADAPSGDLLGTETILVVEDEESVRALCCTVLRRRGYQVLDARGGGEALLLCESHPGPIHLLLTDMVMPRMNGRQLAERLGPLRPSMRVLFMSGYTDDEVLLRGGVTGFLQKPIEPGPLASKVRAVLDGP